MVLWYCLWYEVYYYDTVPTTSSILYSTWKYTYYIGHRLNEYTHTPGLSPSLPPFLPSFHSNSIPSLEYYIYSTYLRIKPQAREGVYSTVSLFSLQEEMIVFLPIYFLVYYTSYKTNPSVHRSSQRHNTHHAFHDRRSYLVSFRLYTIHYVQSLQVEQ